MAKPVPSSKILSSPIMVVGPQYCIPEFQRDLVIVRNVVPLTAENFMVTDILENVLFKLQIQWSLHHSRMLLDLAGNPVVTLRQKMSSMHGRWKVFMGDSHDKKNLLFTSIRRPCGLLKTKMDVFLANNKKEEVPDFSLEGSYSERSCIIYTGDGESKTVLAQMHNNSESTSTLMKFGTYNFIVTVYPNVDYAFIAALMAIFDNINTTNEKMYASTAAAGSGICAVFIC